jgi:hypothetical protein
MPLLCQLVRKQLTYPAHQLRLVKRPSCNRERKETTTDSIFGIHAA